MNAFFRMSVYIIEKTLYHASILVDVYIITKKKSNKLRQTNTTNFIKPYRTDNDDDCVYVLADDDSEEEKKIET